MQDILSQWLMRAAICIVFVAAINLKALPFAWHIRLLRAILWPFLLFPKTYHGERKDSTRLFRPVVTESRSPLFECDFNMHKSNSSYYTDLDIARIHIIATLFGGGLRQLSTVAPPDLPLKAATSPVLGGVTCHFQREIPPYKKYSMETQVLCWDQKWLYLLTRFKTPQGKGVRMAQGAGGEDRACATAVMKVVFKSGRVTVAPKLVIQASGLLPDAEDASWEAAHQQGIETARLYDSLR